MSLQQAPATGPTAAEPGYPMPDMHPPCEGLA